MKQRKCRCGEIRQEKFSEKVKGCCVACQSKYNAERYQRNKKLALEERRQRQQHVVSCPDAVGATFSTPEAVKRFCQARREVKCWREDVYCSCKDCGLQDRVDAGFIPVNFKIMEVSLMARVN